MKTTFIDQLCSARAYDLGQAYFVGMPHFPTHPPFLYSLTKGHGDIVLKNGASSAAEAITRSAAMSGTHIDALCHFSCGGKFHGGVEAEYRSKASITVFLPWGLRRSRRSRPAGGFVRYRGLDAGGRAAA